MRALTDTAAAVASPTHGWLGGDPSPPRDFDAAPGFEIVEAHLQIGRECHHPPRVDPSGDPRTRAARPG